MAYRASPYGGGGGGGNHKTVPCQFFMEGRCTKGEACTFLHGDEGYESAGYGKAGGKSFGKGKDKGGSKGGGGGNFKTVQCEFFKQGTCTKGDACTFLHGYEAAAAPPSYKGAGKAQDPWGGGGSGGNYKTVPCEFFAKGMCTKGEGCTFLHGNEGMAPKGKGGGPPKPSSKFGGAMMALGNKKSVPCVKFVLGQCSKGVACPFLHGENDVAQAPQDNYRTVPCKFFEQGTCQKGDQCTFSHGEESYMEAVPYHIETAPWHTGKGGKGGGGGGGGNFKTVQCEFYAKGMCTKGGACTFLHGDEESYMEAAPWRAAPQQSYKGKGDGGGGGGNFKTVQCEFYAKGMCTKGEACTFLHGDEGMSYGKSSGKGAPSPYGKGAPSYGGKGGTIVLPGMKGAFKGGFQGGKPAHSSKGPSHNFKTVQCEFFGKGQCTRGDACTFLHGDDSESDPYGGKGGGEATFKTVQCSFFAKGQCTKGDACTFLHGTEGMSEIEALAYELEGAGNDFGSALPSSGKKGSGKKGGGGSNYRTVECEFFKKGMCTKGDACTFLHPGGEDQQDAELAALELELQEANPFDLLEP